MTKIKMTEEELRKSIEALVEEALAEESKETKTENTVEETTEETVEKSVSETTVTAEPTEAKKDNETLPTSEKQPESIQKAQTETVDTNSIGELTAEEIELIKEWRTEIAALNAETTEEPTQMTKSLSSQDELVKAIKESIQSEMDELRKARTSQEDMIKSLKDEVTRISKAPAYDTKAITTLETLEKSETPNQPSNQTIGKQQILDKMLQLQLEGKGINSQHVSEMEVTGNISDPTVKRLVMNAFNNKN